MIPNITDYKDKVARNLISLKRVDAENVAIATKQFSALDGSQLPAQVQGVTMTEVSKAISDKQVEVADLQAFQAGLKAAV